MTREQKLAEQGWTRRGTFDEPKLSEVAEMYLELGFEIHLDPLDLEEDVECDACMRSRPELFKTIYTKKSDGR
jgi:hypothetical protein